MQKQQQANNFRAKLEELETAIERQKQNIRVTMKTDPIWGVKAGAEIADGAGEGVEVEEDAETEAQIVSGSGSVVSSTDDAMNLGEIINSDDDDDDDVDDDLLEDESQDV